MLIFTQFAVALRRSHDGLSPPSREPQVERIIHMPELLKHFDLANVVDKMTLKGTASKQIAETHSQ